MDRRRQGPVVALMVVGLLALSGCGANPSGHFLKQTPVSTRSATGGYDASAPACNPTQLELRGIGYVSPMTGEDAFTVVFTNLSKRACNLSGYPTVWFADRSGELPFHFQDGGGPYLWPAAPLTVTAPASSRAVIQFEIAKYRCDLGEARTAATLHFRLPGATREFAISMSSWRAVSYCRGGPKDPGQLVSVDHARVGGPVPIYLHIFKAGDVSGTTDARVHTLLAVILRKTRTANGYRLVLAPARYFQEQYRVIPGQAAVTYVVPFSLVQDPMILIR